MLKYDEINKRLIMANDNDIHKMTNCLSKCDKSAYSAKLVSRHATKLQNKMMLQFHYTSIEHEQRVQVK